MRTGYAGRTIEYYHRNAQDVSLWYEVGPVSPHFPTDRAIYTVPSSRFAIVECVQAHIRRIGVATTLGTAVAQARYYRGGATLFMFAQATLFSNTANDSRDFNTTLHSILFPGDQIRLNTSDSSSGGTVYYYGTARIIEFDALL